MTFALGSASLFHLEGVHPSLVAIVQRAIQITTQDFTVTCGVRSLADEQAAVAAGRSKTMNSKHLVQPDGFGHAVDLVPWADGAATWNWTLIYPVAVAVRQASIEQATALRWGGVWDRILSTLAADPVGMQQAVAAYQARHPGPDFLDGPHYELC